ncbi:class C sortase [Periweissella cryptocerci]|nr:class C sortase [Periweissella cryptocerci]
MNRKKIIQRQRKKKPPKLVDRLITNLIGIIGTLALLYPLVSNFYSAWTEDLAVNRYSQVVKQATKAQKFKATRYISAYNDSLHGEQSALERQVITTDPFTEAEHEKAKTKHTEQKRPAHKELTDNLIGDLVGTLNIPKINQKLPIYGGTSAYQLSQGVGLVEGTSIPYHGKGVHSVIAGHRGLVKAEVFRHLDALKFGDYFYISSNGEEFAYKVDDIRVVTPTEAADFKLDKHKNYVTLMTCTPYMINSHRLLVRGYQVPMNKVAKSWPNWLKPLLWVLGALALLMFLLWLLYRRKKQAPLEVIILYPHPFTRKYSDFYVK